MGHNPDPTLERHDQHRALAPLALDVYDSAAGIGQAPRGWIRASENIALLESAYPALASQTTSSDLRELFAPNSIGVRAELYLPDPTVQAQGTLPVLAFKGTNGEIVVRDAAAPDGVRRVESSISDWANNLIQGTGGESPDYTHAMRMARTLQDGGVAFRATGHSKGGGLATAVATVTDSEAVVFNPAGVHPDTAARFLGSDAGARPGDPALRVTAYKVEGEVLNGGAQDFAAGMSDRSKQQLASVIHELASASRTVPGFDAGLRDAVRSAGVDDTTTERTLETIHRLGSGNTRALLDQFPTAGGRVEPTLRAMERGPDGTLVERGGRTLPETTPALSPVLGALDDIARAARSGRYIGTAAQGGVNLAARGVDGSGDVARQGGDAAAVALDRSAHVAGAAVGATVRGGGEVVASGRQVGGNIHGAAIEAQGVITGSLQQVGAERARQLAAIPFMPDYAQRWLTRSADQLDQNATSTLIDAQRRALGVREQSRIEAETILTGAQGLAGSAADTVSRSTDRAERGLVDAGAAVDRRLDGAAGAMRDGAAYLPAAAAGTAAAAETIREGVRNPALVGYAGIVLSRAQNAAGESVHRHGMGVVIDSLDARRDEIERAAREPSTPSSAPGVSPAPASLVTPTSNDPARDGHPRRTMFRSIESGVHAIDAGLGRTPDAASRNLSYALYAEASTSGWSEVHGVVLGQKTERMAAGEQTFAYRGTPERVDAWVSVPTAQAVSTPPESSLARVEQSDVALQRELAQRTQLEASRGPTMA